MPVLLIASLAVAAATPVEVPQTRCPPPGPHLTAQAQPRPRRLDTLPPASLYLAVDRRIDGCTAPIIVRSTIGGGR